MRIKKLSLFIIVIIAMILSCSCTISNPYGEVTMQEIFDVNNNNAILQRHNSFSVLYENETEKYRFFISPDIRYGYENGIHEVINESEHFQKTEDGIYTKVLYAGVEFIPNTENLLVYSPTTLNEEILECLPKEDMLGLTTRLDQEDGTYIEKEYILKPETLEIASIVETVCDEAGDIISETKCQVKYNQVFPLEASDIINHFKKEEEKEEKRNITLVLDPGTEAEKEYSIEIPLNDSVSIVRPEGYDTIFVDRELTQRFRGDVDLNSDLVLYLANGK